MNTIQDSAPTQLTKWAPKSEEDWQVGLAVLENLVLDLGIQNKPVSREAIAAAVGCSKQAVENIENRVLGKLRRLTSHLRPELEDAGVVQRLAPFKGVKVKGRAPRSVIIAVAVAL